VTSHRPEVAIGRRAFRGTWVGATVVAVGCALTVASTAVTYVSSFPTEASRQQLARLTASSGGLSVLLGPIGDIDTVGGYTFYKGYVFLTSIAAVWAVLITTRSLRGEEDAGRWQLLLSGATRAARATNAVLVGLGGSVLIVLVGVFAGTMAAGLDPDVGFTPWDALAHALSIALVPAVFVGVAAVSSQLGRTRRVATGVAMGVLAVAFVLRMVGDAGPSTRWVRWTTPFGWSELVAPLTSNDLVPLVPAAALIAVTVVVAVAMASRRDVGDGVLRSHDTAPARDRGLGSVTALAVRQETGVLVAWLVGAVAMGLAFGVIAHLTVEGLPSGTRDVIDSFGVRGSFVEQYFGLVLLFVAAVLALLPAGQIGAAAGEELDGRLRLVLAGPTRRAAWLAGRLTIAAVAVTVAALVAGAGLWAGAASQGVDEVSLPTLLGAGLDVVPVCLVALGVGAIVFSVAPRAASASVYVVVGWSLVADIVASLVEPLRWTEALGLFDHLALVPAQRVDWSTVGVTLTVGLGLCVLSVAVFARRDLHAA
jgi:ABC-2 type transport system permease protein